MTSQVKDYKDKEVLLVRRSFGIVGRFVSLVVLSWSCLRLSEDVKGCRGRLLYAYAEPPPGNAAASALAKGQFTL